MGYAVKAPLKRGVEVAMRTSNNANPIEDIVYNMHKFNKAYFWLQKQRSPINSIAAPITAFSNFKSKESISPNNQNYIGIDSIGKFVLVNIQIFLMEV